MKITSLPFNKWWKVIKTKPREQQVEILGNWLKYACKTIANRGDMHQAKVVYTIATRFHKSKYKKLSKYNAKLVFGIVNNKQLGYKRQAQEIRDLKARIAELESTGNKKQTNVIVKRKVHRKIITGGAKYDR